MTIKLERACRIARKLPMAEAEILSSISDSLAKRLTGRELAIVMNALDAHWHKAVAWRNREILGDGYIWDGKADQLRDLMPPKDSTEYAANYGRVPQPSV